jgi:carboxypeptidase T
VLVLVFAAFSVLPAYAADHGALQQLKSEAGVTELPGVDKPQSGPLEPRYWVVVRAATPAQRTALAQGGMSIEEIKSDRVSGIAHFRTIEKLQAQGFVIERQISLAEYHNSFIQAFPPQDKAYHDYARLTADMRSLVQAQPGLVSMFSIGKTWQGRDIWALRFNTEQAGVKPSAKPGAVFVGNHHAREHLSVEVPLRLAQHLAKNRNEASIRRLLDQRDIYIIPMLNPDGAEYDIATGEYRWHRKNMRVNPDGELGVDLNRNYDFIFGGPGASGDTYSETYHGPSAFSEPETQAFKAFLEARPNVKVMNSFHSYSELILYPWGGKDEQISDARDRKAFQVLAQAMAKLTGYRAMQSSGLYVATGDCTDWAYAALGIFAFTTELYPSGGGGGGFYPGAKVIEKVAKGNISAAIYLLEHADDPRAAAWERSL